MKLGDVNNSWDFTVAKTEEFAGAVNIDIPSAKVLPGEDIKLPVTVRQFKAMSGCQFTINWNSEILLFEEVENAAINAEFGLLKKQEGAISVLWTADNATSLDLEDGTVLFYLTFKALGNLGEFTDVKITSLITPVEAVNNNLELVEVISSEGLVNIGEQSLSENSFTIYPNPNNGLFTIEHNLVTAQDLSLDIYNAQGQLVFNNSCQKINNGQKIEINLRDKAAGIYVVKLAIGEGVLTKMIKVE